MASLAVPFVCCCLAMFVRADLLLDDKDKKQIVDIHNDVRSKEGATKMNKLVWSDNLATTAEGTVAGCVFKHSDYTAENIATLFGFGSKSGLEGFGKTSLINILVKDGMPSLGLKSWFLERDNVVSFDTLKCQTGEVCGHYTQMVKDEASKVGCAAKYCSTLKAFGTTVKNAWFLSCDYDKGNMIGVAAFKKGESCSECPTGTNCENNLCVE